MDQTVKENQHDSYAMYYQRLLGTLVTGLVCEP